ncbi:MAG: cation-transporting P-type ATPase [Trebonia sp.]
MTVRARAEEGHGAKTASWYARSPDEVATALGVDQGAGLSSARAAELLTGNGPNALPEEVPGPDHPPLGEAHMARGRQDQRRQEEYRTRKGLPWLTSSPSDTRTKRRRTSPPTRRGGWPVT